MNYFVLFKDDFGDKHLAKFENLEQAQEFYRIPSNVLFKYAIVSIDEIWQYVLTAKSK